MADATVEIPDEDSIVVLEEGAEAAPVPAPKPVATPAAEEAVARLNEAIKAAEEQRRLREAADATAMAERRRAEEASRREEQSRQAVVEALDRAGSSELALATTGVESATRALDAAKTEFQRAFDAGEAAKMADAQAMIADATADLKEFKRQKIAAEANTRRPHEGRVEPVREAVASPDERYIAQFAPEAQSWLRAHRDCLPAEIGGSARRNAAMMEGHYAALRQNVTPNTPKYFEILEKAIDEKQPVEAAPAPAPAPAPAQRPKPLPSAPPTNEPPVKPGMVSGRRSVQLNPAQQEVALFSYPARRDETEEAHRKRAFGTYARELIAATAEGKIGRLTH